MKIVITREDKTLEIIPTLKMLASRKQKTMLMLNIVEGDNQMSFVVENVEDFKKSIEFLTQERKDDSNY